MTRRLPRALLLGLALALPASADWPPGGKLVSSPGDINGVRNARIFALPSGDLVVLGVGVGGNSNTYNIQRLTHGGLFSPGWPANGVPFTVVLKSTTLRAQSIIVDDASRVWHTWPTANAMLESISKDGSTRRGRWTGSRWSPRTRSVPAARSRTARAARTSSANRTCDRSPPTSRRQAR